MPEHPAIRVAASGEGPPDILQRLAEASDDPIAGKAVAVVFAHPDDETLALGGQLSRLAGATLVLVTDGAPADGSHLALGFPSRAGYASARAEELAAALRAGDSAAMAPLAFGFADRTAVEHLDEIAFLLASLFESRRIRVVFTHAYEGGHPDHDAVAWAVDAARRLGPEPVEVLEFPLYRAGRGGWAYRSFASPEGARALALTPRRREAKLRMLAAYRSQRAVIAQFPTIAETCRPAAPAFGDLPNGGALLYREVGSECDGAALLARMRAAEARLFARA